MDALSHQNNPRQRKGKGRRKIKIEKIKNEANLQVTFSKRRAGLFKKASELDTLCGCESAIVAFSPSEKAYSYGNPDVETIAGMFWNHTEGSNHRINGFNHGHNNVITRQCNQMLTDMETQLELEKRHKKELKKMRQENQGQNGGTPNLDELNYQQLDELKKSVLNFKQNFEAKVQNSIDQSWIDEDINAIGFSSGSNAQGSGYYGANYYPTTGAGYVEPSYPDPTFFSEMTTTNTEYVDPFDATNNNNLGLPFRYPHVAGGSNPIDEQTMRTDAGTENTFVPWGYVEDNIQGFPSSYGGDGY